MTDLEAPTFETARGELYALLEDWTFGKVLRQCVVPDDAREESADGKQIITYYHGMAATLRTPNQNDTQRRIWFKKPLQDDDPVEVGPVVVPPAESDFVPKPGDTLMGKVVENSRSGRQGWRYVRWYPHARSLHALFNLVRHGTSKSETQLSHDLRVRGGNDDTWALARLVLFGNVAAFAEQHLQQVQQDGTDSKKRNMRLSIPPLEFVHVCAQRLRDDSIWTEFVKLVPDAVPPPRRQAVQRSSAASAEPSRPVVRPFVPPPRQQSYTQQFEQRPAGMPYQYSGYTTSYGSQKIQQQQQQQTPQTPQTPPASGILSAKMLQTLSSLAAANPSVFAPPSTGRNNATYNYDSDSDDGEAYNPDKPHYDDRNVPYSPTSPAYSPPRPDPPALETYSPQFFMTEEERVHAARLDYMPYGYKEPTDAYFDTNVPRAISSSPPDTPTTPPNTSYDPVSPAYRPTSPPPPIGGFSSLYTPTSPPPSESEENVTVVLDTQTQPQESGVATRSRKRALES